ncbi:MAG: hypothetical protein U0610_18655 [bacterium]
MRSALVRARVLRSILVAFGVLVAFGPGFGCGSDDDGPKLAADGLVPPLTEDFGKYFLTFANAPVGDPIPSPGGGPSFAVGSVFGLYSDGARAAFLVYPGTRVTPSLSARFVGEVIDASTIRIDGGQVDTDDDSTFVNDLLTTASGELTRDADGLGVAATSSGLRLDAPYRARYPFHADYRQSVLPLNGRTSPDTTWADEFLAAGFAPGS